MLKTFVHARSHVGWFRFENLRTSLRPQLIAPKYQKDPARPDSTVPGNDVSRLGYPMGTISASANRIDYHQPGWDKFSYNVSIAWRNVGTAVEGVWSISSQWKNTTNMTAKDIVATAFRKSFSSDSTSHVSWWKNFWRKILQDWTADVRQGGGAPAPAQRVTLRD